MVIVDNEEELDAILDKYFTCPFRFGHVKVKGVTMPKRYAEMEEEIYNWEVNDKDIWMCSFPKTGTTWTAEMIWLIENNLDFAKADVNIQIRVPFLEISSIFDYRELTRTNKEFNPPSFLNDSLAFVKEQPTPRIMKTHLPWKLLPNAIQDGTKKAKIVYVTRNPKDTCISYYNHVKLLEGYSGSFEDFCRLFLAGKVSYAPYWEHIFAFWERRNLPNVLFLKYEELKKDLPAVIRRVAKFLEKDLTDEQVIQLTNHLSFENMRNNPAVNYEMVVNMYKKFNLTEANGTFMRSGQVGDYKVKMSPELIKKFDEWTEENLKDTDFSFK
ncbi:hypothetical protein NQ318_009504, partial [Aromia moschata]